MIARVARLLILLTFVALVPRVASAHGISIRGQEIQRNGVITGSVGECSCTDEWYTAGFRPGKMTIIATITGHSGVARVSYGIRIGVLHGMQSVGFSQAACLASQRRCGAKARITARIQSAGAYYLKVSGLGANGISYSIHIQGRIYRLR
jgi:hypothetical protein